MPIKPDVFVPCRFCGDTQNSICCTTADGEFFIRDLAADVAPLEGHELAAVRDAYYGGIAGWGQEGAPHLQAPHNGRDPRFVYGLLDAVGYVEWRVEYEHEAGNQLDPDAIY